jgi:hypothetical protein
MGANMLMGANIMLRDVGRRNPFAVVLTLGLACCAIADILEFERIGAVGTLVAYRPDQTRTTVSGQGKDGQEIGFVEIDM